MPAEGRFSECEVKAIVDRRPQGTKSYLCPYIFIILGIFGALRRAAWCRRGLEPPLPCENYDLNVARLPIPPSGHGVGRRSDTCRCAGRQRGMQRRAPCRTRKSLPAVSAGPPDAWSAFDLAEIRLPAQDWTTRRPAMIRQAPMAYFTVSGSFRKKAAISGTSTKVSAMKE